MQQVATAYQAVGSTRERLAVRARPKSFELSVVTDSYDVFHETICSFYGTLVRHSGAAPALSDPEMIAAEAFTADRRTCSW
jgi:hypothetical protein